MFKFSMLVKRAHVLTFIAWFSCLYVLLLCDVNSVAGGYLCCDGKGHTLRFSVQRCKAFVR
jgi:hypothetical protein